MKKFKLAVLHTIAYLWILSMVCAMYSCSMRSAAGGAAGGAAIGSLGGPRGAALGGAAGSLTGSVVADSFQEAPQPVVLPSGEIVMPQPETAWGLLGKLLDVAPGLIILGIVIWLLSLFAPSPVESIRNFLSNVSRKKTTRRKPRCRPR